MRKASKLECLVFYIIYASYIINSILSESNYSENSMINKLLFCLRMIIMLSYFIFCILKKYDLLYISSIGLFMIFSILSVIFSSNGITLVFMGLIILASANIPLKRIFQISIYTIILAYAFVILSSLVGIIENNILSRYLDVGIWSGSYTRMSLGFLNANQVPLTFLYLFFMYIVLKKEKIKFFDIMGFVIVGLVIYSKCNARTPLILLILTSVFCVILKIKLNLRFCIKNINLYKYLYMFIFPICLVFSFLTTIFYQKDNGFMQRLDHIFNSRISYAHDALNFYGLKFLGQGKLVGTYNGALENNTVDNGYIITFLQSGIILGLIIILLCIILTYIAIRAENKYLLFVLCMIAIANLIDCQFTSYRMLPFYCILLNGKAELLSNNKY